MNRIKKDDGITIIALVITIIVMLILVVVTINISLNEGLFNYAFRAVDETEDSIDNEQELADGKIQLGNKKFDSIDDAVDSIKFTVIVNWTDEDDIEHTKTIKYRTLKDATWGGFGFGYSEENNDDWKVYVDINDILLINDKINYKGNIYESKDNKLCHNYDKIKDNQVYTVNAIKQQIHEVEIEDED